MNSLEVNQTSEERIREELQKELSTMYEQLQKANTDNTEKSKSLDVANRNNNTLQEQLKADNTTLDNSNKQLQDKLINNADMLTFYKENISKLESDIEGYKADVKSLEGTHKQDVVEKLKQNTESIRKH